MTPDTTALRARLRDDCALCGHNHQPYVEVPREDFIALCAAADEVERLRRAVWASEEIDRRAGMLAGVEAERDASRTAHAALVAGIETGLRESACAECDHDRCATYRSAASWVRDLADRHAPTTGATP